MFPSHTLLFDHCGHPVGDVFLCTCREFSLCGLLRVGACALLTSSYSVVSVVFFKQEKLACMVGVRWFTLKFTSCPRL